MAMPAPAQLLSLVGRLPGQGDIDLVDGQDPGRSAPMATASGRKEIADVCKISGVDPYPVRSPIGISIDRMARPQDASVDRRSASGRLLLQFLGQLLILVNFVTDYRSRKGHIEIT